MKIQDVMTRNPEFVRPGTSLTDAAEMMRRLDVGVLPLGDGGRVAGLITDRDITIRGVAQGFDPKEHTVDEIATRNVVSVKPEQTVEEVAQLMKEKQIRRVCVVNQNEDLVGIVSLGDLALETQKGGDVLKQVSKPS